MLLEKEDGMINALGSFKADDVGSIRTIYEAANDGPLSGLAFRIDESGLKSIVGDVLPVIGDSPPPPQYEAFRNMVSNIVNPGLRSFTDGWSE
ncbi:hypothetical protein IMZ48_39620 [Candidatus Bathyarchaeota archaeon]|nr:hypothetical protein [Candidatus Bathyarchaeota archaeon]